MMMGSETGRKNHFGKELENAREVKMASKGIVSGVIEIVINLSTSLHGYWISFFVFEKLDMILSLKKYQTLKLGCNSTTA